MVNKKIKFYVPQLTDSEEVWGAFVRWLFDMEADAIFEKVNSDPRLKNIKAPEEIREGLWRQIQKCENKKESVN